MIVFYTKYNVKESFNRAALIAFAFECVHGMRNIPDEFKSLSYDDADSGEWRSGRNLITYEIDQETSDIAFRVAIVDENDELWTTDVVLNEKSHIIQLRLAREKKIASADYDRNFNIPYMFKKLIRDGIGDWDSDIQVSDKPMYIDENNIGMLISVIKKEKSYDLPIIHVSHPFENNTYELDVEELAKDMAGSAHVLVEKSSITSKLLKESTDSKNAYNGAIDIFYHDDSFRYMRWHEITPNQYRYKISHAVYSRMAMRNIDEESSLSSIKLRNRKKKLEDTSFETQFLSLEIEELKEKDKERAEYFDLLIEENKKLEKRINELENSNYELRSKVDFLTDALKRDK